MWRPVKRFIFEIITRRKPPPAPTTPIAQSADMIEVHTHAFGTAWFFSRFRLHRVRRERGHRRRSVPSSPSSRPWVNGVHFGRVAYDWTRNVHFFRYRSIRRNHGRLKTKIRVPTWTPYNREYCYGHCNLTAHEVVYDCRFSVRRTVEILAANTVCRILVSYRPRVVSPKTVL